MEITKREILVSISIVAVMIAVGFLISGKISEHEMDKNEKYNKAVKINSQELFRHGMDTSVGDAFVYGDLQAVDTVSYPELDGEYMYVEKVKEIYTKHTRTVTVVDGNGKTHTTTEVYWTWDTADREDIRCKEVIFCGVEFSSGKIRLPAAVDIDTIYDSFYVRYRYYGVEVKHTGTIFTRLNNGSISDNSRFFENSNIEETISYLETESKGGVILFWIFWIAATAALVYVFCYLDNNWLE